MVLFPTIMRCLKILTLIVVFLSPASSLAQIPSDPGDPDHPDSAYAPTQQESRIFLPGIIGPRANPAPVPGGTPRINVPSFSSNIPLPQMAVFWFGKVSAQENYTDVRVGSNTTELNVVLSTFDRQLWHAQSPTRETLTHWDAATLYINLGGNQGNAPGSQTYRFVAQLNNSQDRSAFQAAYQGTGNGWTTTTASFTSISGWRGEGLNDNNREDRGWTLRFRIPFSSLGLNGPPAEGTIWGLAVRVHDQDESTGPTNPDQIWPDTQLPDQPATWGQLRFGLSSYQSPIVTPGGTVTIRQGLNGAVVPDVGVGGTIGNLCPGNSNYIWNQWGDANFGGDEGVNIQNQSDVADWPCFAKYYISFPLNAIPADKVIINATVTLHQFGGSDPANAERSLIQASTIVTDWNESTINWNNAPFANENVSRSWVEPTGFPGWPGIVNIWDLSKAVAEAYARGETHVRLVFYSADGAYHSGKHFVTSETEDWNAIARPTLSVTWGNP